MNQRNLVLEWTEPNEFEDEHDEYSTSRRKNDEYTAKYINRQLNINEQDILSKDHSQCPQNTSVSYDYQR